MDKLKYNPKVDRLIHVGDLIAKGTKNDEVLTWMRENQIQGVRGNHDQPVRIFAYLTLHLSRYRWVKKAEQLL